MSPQLAAAFIAELDDQALDQLAALLAPRLAPAEPTASPWLDVQEAADRLRCSKQRVYDLTHARLLTPARDGRRLLFHRDHVDTYLRGKEQHA